MKKLILIIAFIIPSIIKAQDCNFIEDKVDEFTNASLLATKPVRVTSGMYEIMVIGFRKVNDSYYLKMEYAQASGVIAKDDLLMFKMADSTILKIRSTETVTPNHFYISGISNSSFSCKYSITKEQIEKISKLLVDKIRFYTTDGYFEVTVNEKNGLKLINSAVCILSK